MILILPGEPISQARMKFSGRGGFGRVYDPREKQKREIKKIIKDKWQDRGKLEHPRASFIFYMPIPKSTPKKKLFVYNSGYLKHEKKPDVDNLLKLYLDCLDTIAFDGDQKVSLGPCVKLYHPEPRTVIILQETQDIITSEEMPEEFWAVQAVSRIGKPSSGRKASLRDCSNQGQPIFPQWTDSLNRSPA